MLCFVTVVSVCVCRYECLCWTSTLHVKRGHSFIPASFPWKRPHLSVCVSGCSNVWEKTTMERAAADPGLGSEVTGFSVIRHVLFYLFYAHPVDCVSERRALTSAAVLICETKLFMFDDSAFAILWISERVIWIWRSEYVSGSLLCQREIILQ